VFLFLFFPLCSHAEGDFDFNAVGTKIAQNVEFHGYYEFEYWSEQEKNNSFDAHKIVVWMGVPVNTMVFLSSEFEYEHFPRLEDGTVRPGGNGELKLDSAQLRITPIENSAVYMGVFYVPFGIEYFSYPGHKNKLVTRPKVMKSGGIIPGTWSDVGIGFNQVFDRVGEVDLFYVNGDAKTGGVSRDSSSGGNEGKTAGIRFMFNRAIEGLNIGVSYASGKHDEAGRLYAKRYGVHLRIDLDVITEAAMAPVLLGEYVSGTNEGVSSVLNSLGTPKDQDVSGFYAQLSSKVFPGVQLVTRYGQFDEDKKKADNGKTELSVGAVLTPLTNFLLKGEYHLQWNDGKNNAIVAQAVVHW
ncbi:MAG: hypothetical protein ACE5FU_08670, partial [Nitrospinota bacterium]